MGIRIKCKFCRRMFTVTRKHRIFCSVRCAMDQENLVNKGKKKLHFQRRVYRLNQIKLSKGCLICGYKKCGRALCFHHTRKDKKVKISGYEGSEKAALRETKKCIVLCANCHMELHAGIINLPGKKSLWSCTKLKIKMEKSWRTRRKDERD